MKTFLRTAFVLLVSIIFILSSIILDSENSRAGTTVSGTISTDTNWTPDGSPYTVVGDIIVEEGVTLTVEASVQVLFEGSYYILVNGNATLRSLGESGANVFFMPMGSLWDGISVMRYGHLELRNSTIYGANKAVQIASDNNNISGNHFEGKDGIYNVGSNNLIESNEFVGSPGDVAIWIHNRPRNNTIRGNRFLGAGGGFILSGDRHLVENNYFEGTGGIVGDATNTTIRGNVFLDGLIGIQLTFQGSVGYSEKNEIYGNWIERSSLHAIFLECQGCRVWNNTFMDNRLFGSSQGVDDNGLSHWNQSYPTGGNYWSNYLGPDDFHGPGQNIPGSDGIGDVPYPIYNTTYDYYPLVNFTPPLPDIAVYDDETVFDPPGPVEEGESVEISAVVHNIGLTDAINVFVRFFDGDPMSGVQIDGDQLIGSLPMKSIEWVKVTWTAQGIGQHDVCVVADPDDITRELNEDNNQACASIEVVPAGPPLPPTDLDAHLSGSGFENVTIVWNLSADDSAGKNSVVGYDIYRADTYSSNTSTYQLPDSVPKGTSEYVDADAGEGDPSDYFYIVCAVNAANDSSCSTNQAAKFTRPLTNGPNLVSIPIIQSDESIETALQTVEYDKAWFYDSSSREWKWYMTSKEYRRGLWNVDHTMGIWMNVTEDSNLTAAGVVPAQTTIHLHEGWNLVSFPSFNASYSVSDMKAEIGATRVEGYDIAPPNFLRVLGDAEVLQAGYGYWARAEAETVWVITFE
ncbi:MAG: hypothetical protein E3J35_08430 [Methanomassiliicoccales archaeon]|nr:MAG: hypothetical protein E3J35_08430 [Methanomassiliicoccales archaeon]